MIGAFVTTTSPALYGAAARAAVRHGQVPTEAFRGSVIPTGQGPAYPAASVQGGSLRTWSQDWPSPEHNEVVLGTDGRPLDANVEVWAGPGNTPRRMRVYSEDGFLRPFRSSEPPRGRPNTVAVRNTGPLEFPISAHIAATPPPTTTTGASIPAMEDLYQGAGRGTVQGGATKSFPVDASVDSVQIFLQTEGRNLDAKLEVIQGPDCVRQVIELNEDWGYDRPFSCVLDTPGYGCVVRIINTAPIEFPFTASVVPQTINQGGYGYDSPYATVGGGASPAMGYSDPYGARVSSGWGGQSSLGSYSGSQYGLSHGSPYGSNVY